MSGTPNMANRCLSVLRMALDYALEMQWIDSNPAIGIRRHREQQRGRLLSAQEYGAIYRQAGPRLQVIMDLCYLTGQRISDVLAIRRSQIRDGGKWSDRYGRQFFGSSRRRATTIGWSRSTFGVCTHQ